MDNNAKEGHPPYHDLEPYRVHYMIGSTKKAEYKCQRPIPDDLQYFLDTMFVADPESRATVGSLLKSEFIIKRKKIGHFYDGVPSENLGKFNAFVRNIKCLDVRSNEYFVIKYTFANVDNNDEVNLLKNKIDIYASMPKHPNIVQYLGLFVQDGKINIMSEYIEGSSLRDMLDKCDKITIMVCASYTRQVLEGLHFLHQKDIIHGNMKASNIMVHSNGTLKLSDYGVMMDLGRLFENTDDQPIFDKYILAHAYWMAPETILDRQYTMYSDVWSVAVTIIEMLTGNTIYSKEKLDKVITKITDTKNIKKEYPPSIPEKLHNLLDSIFVYDPTERPLVESLLQSKFITTNGAEETDENVSSEPRGATGGQ